VRRILTVGAVAVVVAGALFGAYAARHADALDAVASTVYPGQRAAEGGGTASLVSVLSAPFDVFASGSESGRISGSNQSESSSGLLLVVPVAVVVLLLAQRTRLRREEGLFPLLGVLGALGLVAAWMFVPLPSWVGTPLLLNRVASSRLVLPLVLGGIVAFVLLLDHLRRREEPLGPGPRVVAVAVMAAPYLWAAGQLRVEDEPVNRTVAFALLACVAVGCFFALGRRSLVGLSVLVAFSVVVGARVNPLQHGLDPLTENPLARAIADVRSERPRDDGWVMFGGDFFADGVLTASGVDNVGAVSFYPDPEEWEVIDRDGSREPVWNRYAHVRFQLGERGSRPRIDLDGGDSVAVTIDACDPRLAELGVDVMIVPWTDDPACGNLLRETNLGGSRFRIYEVEPARP